MNAQLKKFEKYRSMTEDGLKKFCAQNHEEIPDSLLNAMTYSLNAGGKRVRPVLCLAAAELSGVRGIAKKILPMALCLEIFHTSTLVLDDLPCMDDDTLRRGKPTCHVVHGEAVALLAGGVMPLWGMRYAMNALVKNELPFEDIFFAMQTFLQHAEAVFGGQVLDIDVERDRSLEEAIRITSMKTAALITGVVKTGAILAGISGGQQAAARLSAVEKYGYYLGMCFQIVDDILDETATAENLGKTPGKDKAQGKKTFPQLLGLDGARELAKETSKKAIAELEIFGKHGEFLRNFARVLLERGN